MSLQQKYCHIIWDWNGTLLNDAVECVTIVSGLMEKRGLGQLTMERYQREVVFPVIGFYERLGFDFKREPFDIVADEYIKAYLQTLPHCRLHDGAAATLRELTAHGYTHSVLSAYQQERLREAVRHFGLNDWFVKLIGLNDYYARSKVDNGRQWIKEMSWDKSQVVMVGDMLHDFEVAQAMGVDCVLLTCGHQSRQVLAGCGVPMFDSHADLKPWLLERGGGEKIG